MLYVLILIVGFAAQYFLPWWSMPLVCFGLSAWLGKSGKEAFWVSAAGIVSLWLGYAVYLHSATGGVMTQKIAQVFVEKYPNPAIMFVLTAIVGGLVAGTAGLAGYFVRQAAAKPEIA